MNAMYVCVLAGCKKDGPEVYDIVTKDKILSTVSMVATTFVLINDTDEDVICYKTPSLKHEFKYSCLSNCEKHVYFIKKWDRSVADCVNYLYENYYLI
jgi:ABC-type transport system involved in Fe-S cluster assembly fused permease/ATPase subunit